MALAAYPPEVRIARILQLADQPLTAAAIHAQLVIRYRMPLKKRAVNEVLYNSSAYVAVPGTKPPKWYMKGSPAAAALAERVFGELLSLDDLPDDAFLLKNILIAGQCENADHVAEVVKLVLDKGANTIFCLVDHQSGKVAHAVLEALGHASTAIPYPSEDRRGIVSAHREAHRQADTLIVIGSPLAQDYNVHHLVAAFEVSELPVYLAPPKNIDTRSGCEGCT